MSPTKLNPLLPSGIFMVSNANALFAGGDITEDDKAKVLEAIQEAYWQAKLINKKYTPKKYRNNNNPNE